MKITVLSENLTNQSAPNLINEHGISLFIETEADKILFDTGRGDIFAKNALQLGIDLANITKVVISHHHADHIGGLECFLEQNSQAKIYLTPLLGKSYLFKFLFWRQNIGINVSFCAKYKNRIVFVKENLKITDNLMLITDVVQDYPASSTNKYLYCCDGDKCVPDDFKHEMFLVVRENNQQNIITGCSHRGIKNILATVYRMHPELPINGLVGGFHLLKHPLLESVSISDSQIQELVNQITELGIKSIYTGHCTGVKAYHKLKHKLGNTINYLQLGSSYIF